MTANVWIVDDEPSICWALCKSMEQEGYRVCVFSSAEAFLDNLGSKSESPDVVFLDVRLPGISGIETLSNLRRSHRHLPVVVMTAFGDLKTAVDVIKSDSFEYLTKPFSIDAAISAAKRAIRELATTNNDASLNAIERPSGESFLGMSPQMQRVYKQIAIAAQGDWPTLVVGDQGVGKSSVCRLIHTFSGRSHKPLLTFRPNPSDPMECQCELFGVQSEAVPPAEPTRWQANRPGLLQLGEAGTVVIDEVLLLPIHLQVRLLEAMESQSCLPIGGSSPHPLTARLLFTSTTAINADIDDVEMYPQLRAQLRLNVIEIPPLSQRAEDIPHLTLSLLQKLSPAGELSITDDAMAELRRRPWPGNLRELNQTIQAAAQRCSGKTIRSDDFTPPSKSMAEATRAGNTADEVDRAVRQWVADHCHASLDTDADADADSTDADSRATESFLYEECLQVVERALFEAVLQATDGNRAKSAELLGIHRTTLRQKSKRLGMD